jgi:hypothetical protein
LFLKYSARDYWPNELTDLAVSSGFRIVERGFLWPTFENISGRQPALLRVLRGPAM